jgi:hypothetical protein
LKKKETLLEEFSKHQNVNNMKTDLVIMGASYVDQPNIIKSNKQAEDPKDLSPLKLGVDASVYQSSIEILNLLKSNGKIKIKKR